MILFEYQNNNKQYYLWKNFLSGGSALTTLDKKKISREDYRVCLVQTRIDLGPIAANQLGRSVPVLPLQTKEKEPERTRKEKYLGSS